MATLKQKRVARALLEVAGMDKPPTAGEIVESSGYGISMKKNPQVVLESQGVKDALAEYGLTEELITTALVSDIKAKKKNRLGELRLGAELLGKLKGDVKPTQTNIINIFGGDQLKRIAARVLDGDAESAGTLNRLPDSN